MMRHIIKIINKRKYVTFLDGITDLYVILTIVRKCLKLSFDVLSASALNEILTGIPPPQLFLFGMWFFKQKKETISIIHTELTYTIFLPTLDVSRKCSLDTIAVFIT